MQLPAGVFVVEVRIVRMGAGRAEDHES
jgi:hypothetical protein